MPTVIFRITIAFAAVILLGAVLAAGEKQKERAVEVFEPEDGQAVERFEEMQGQLAGPGWPVVLVKALLPDEPWWVQPPVANIEEDGAFATDVYFGNDRTPAGTKFRLVVLVAKDKSAADKFKRGANLKRLPRLPRSIYVNVTRK